MTYVNPASAGSFPGFLASIAINSGAFDNALAASKGQQPTPPMASKPIDVSSMPDNVSGMQLPLMSSGMPSIHTGSGIRENQGGRS